VLYTAAGLGGALGGLVMGQYLRRLPYAVAISFYAMSAPLLGALALVHQVELALLLFACSTAAGTAGDLIFTISVQRHVKAEERGRAFGMMFWCIAIGQLIGAALAMIVTTQTAVAALLWVSMGAVPVIFVGALISIRAEQPSNAVPANAMTESPG